jgi:hypothetical protein
MFNYIGTIIAQSSTCSSYMNSNHPYIWEAAVSYRDTQDATLLNPNTPMFIFLWLALAHAQENKAWRILKAKATI